MKKIVSTIGLISLVATLTFAQWSLDVEGDGKIGGNLELRKDLITDWGFNFHHYEPGLSPVYQKQTWMRKAWNGIDGDYLYLGSTGNRDIGLQSALMLTERTGFAIGRPKNDIGGGLNNKWFRINGVGKTFITPDDACTENDSLELSVSIDRDTRVSCGLILHDPQATTQSRSANQCGTNTSNCTYTDYLSFYPENLTNATSFHSEIGKFDKRWTSLYVERANAESLLVKGEAGPLVYIESKNNNNWDLTRSDGDFRIGTYTHHLEMTTSTSGLGAGIARIEVDGGPGKLIFGSNNEEVLALEKGKVNVTGSIYQNNSLIHSDRRFKKDIKPIKNPLQSIQQLTGTSYQFRTGNFTSRSFSNQRQLGLIAQEVEKVFPELVKTNEDGYKAVNYDGLIPVLIEAVKAQQVVIETQKETTDEQQKTVVKQQEKLKKQAKKIDQLESKITALAVQVDKLLSNNASATVRNKYALSLEQKSTLGQNHPNPFNQNTSIDFFLPTTVQAASLQIRSANGQLIKTLPIPDRGAGQLTIDIGNYAAGTYFYSLVLDEQVLETKQMIVAK